MDKPERTITLLHQLRRCGHYLHHNWSCGRASQNRVLRILEKHGELTQRQLQDIMGIQQGSLSELLKKMEEHGLIDRRQSPDDRRQILVRLTERGEAQSQLNHERMAQQAVELTAVLSGEEQQQLQVLLAKLLDSWEERREKEPVEK